MAADADAFVEHGHVFVVADGMGGHAVGELASKMAVDAIPLAFFKHEEESWEEAIRQSFEETNTAIHQRGERNHDFKEMGTTCSMLALTPDGAVIGHVGDSRIYRIRQQRIDQLTFDHSLQWEMIRSGKYRPEQVMLQQPKNVITRCLGPMPQVQVDIEGPFPVLPGDVYLLCTDGLTSFVSDEELGVIATHLAPREACRLLINLANLRGGTDNITVVIARVGGTPAPDAVPVPDVVVRSNRVREVEPGSPAIGWVWLAIWSVYGLFLSAGISQFIVGRVEQGLTMLVIMISIFFGLLFAWFRTVRPLQRSESDESVVTTIWRPYRSCLLELRPVFLKYLENLMRELEQMGRQEEWTVDWKAYQQASESSARAIQETRLNEALESVSAAIHVLMAGMQTEKRRMDYITKWGVEKTPLPPTKSS